MLSVGSRDGERKRSMLGLEGRRGAEGRQMEENELEEGEAYFGQDEDIDPDALSYIDEKLQHVLGHFQKEFEGGVSAETLGAKFGGYGSFLPAYQRSPPVTLSQPKSPAKAPIHNLSRSPHNLQPEVGCQNGSVLANASFTKASSSSVVHPVEKPSKRDTCISSCHVEGIPQQEFTRQTLDIRDPKSLKVRIKVGPDNVLIRNKPEIYSDLGLDISPSPSLEDSPGGSEEISPDAFAESPSTILQVMTQFLVPGSYLLSPLSENLLRLFDKEHTLIASIKKSMSRNLMAENCSASSKDLTHNDNKSKEKYEKLMQFHGMTSEDVTTGLKNEIERKASDVQNVILSNQLPSSTRCAEMKEEVHLGGNSINENSNLFVIHTETNNIPKMEKVQAIDLKKNNQIEFIDCGKMDGADNLDKEIIPLKGKPYSKPHMLGKEFEETNGSSGISMKSKSKCQKPPDKKKSDYDKHSMRKHYSTGFEEPVKEQPVQKACTSENKLIQDKNQAFEDGKMIKGNQNEAQFIEPNMEKKSTLFSVAHKGKKKTFHVKDAHLETKSKISNSKKEINKGHSTETQGELLLSAQAQQVESRTHVLSSSIPSEKSNEKTDVNKGDNFHIAGPVIDSLAPLIDAAPESEPVPAIPAIVLIEDNWVCCDICQRWRLLPYGTKPESLPKKWHCSMQVWLPGLNNCNVRENETTKAFHELYQFPAPGGDANVTAHLNAAASSITFTDRMNPGRSLENVMMHNAPQNGKKKNGSTDVTNLPSDPSLTNLPTSLKNLVPSSGNKDFIDVRYCAETESLSKPKPEWTCGSMNISAEKHIDKQNKKHATSSSFKFGGNFSERSKKYSKPMSNTGTDVDGHRTSKKLKKDGSYHLIKDLHASIDTAGKVAANGDTELSAKAPKNILQNYNGRSKDLKSKSGASKKSGAKINTCDGQHKEVSDASGAEKSSRYDSNDKKRKLKERQEMQSCQEISMSSERVAGSKIISKEALNDGESRRQKKAKVAKPEGKESRTVIGGGNVEMKSCSTIITLSSNRKQPADEIDGDGLQAATDEQLLHYQGNTISGHALDCIERSKRDMTYMKSLVSTSSSSKVSGSQKGKLNLLETKGSPVESVSSSPMRILSTENNSAKDNVISMGYSGMGSPKRFSDGDFDGSSDQSGTRVKDSSNEFHRSSEIYRSADSGVLDSLKASRDYEDTETRRLTGVKSTDRRQSKIIKRNDASSTDIAKVNIMCDGGSVPQHPKKYHLERPDKHHTYDENERCRSGHKNSVKNSSHSREKHRSSNADKGNLKVSSTVIEHKELHSYRTSNNRQAETEFDNLNSSKKTNSENHSKQHKAHELGAAIASENQNKSTSQQNPQHTSSHDRQNPSALLITEAIDRPVVDLGKGMQFSSQAKDKIEKKVSGPQKAAESIKGFNLERCPVDALNIEASKSTNPSRKLDEQNGTLPNLLRQPGTSVPGSSSPMKKDGHPNVNNVMKEARDLKHTANRLKSLGLEDESSGIFFESALKFLYAAFLLEPPNSESTKQGELVPSAQVLVMYYETAKFCEFCAHEYERLKQMVAAALAYKCAEVAYFKVAYYKHPSASKDRLELQTALDAPMPGESPSSSASDVDNLNNQGGIDKVASTRALSSPQIAGSHAIAARNRPHVMRLLVYMNYLSCAFEATRKSHNAIAAAGTDQGKSSIDVCSARKVLDFNFHNVEGLLRLVRVSMNPTGH